MSSRDRRSFVDSSRSRIPCQGGLFLQGHYRAGSIWPRKLSRTEEITELDPPRGVGDLRALDFRRRSTHGRTDRLDPPVRAVAEPRQRTRPVVASSCGGSRCDSSSCWRASSNEEPRRPRRAPRLVSTRLDCVRRVQRVSKFDERRRGRKRKIASDLGFYLRARRDSNPRPSD
jgi:hypothetical protein